MTKRISCLGAVALALVLLAHVPARAQSFGSLDGTRPFKLALSQTDNGLLTGTVTVFWLKAGAVFDVELLSTSPLVDVTIPRRTSRILYLLAPSQGGTITFHLEQGSKFIDEAVQTPAIFAFDVVDGPIASGHPALGTGSFAALSVGDTSPATDSDTTDAFAHSNRRETAVVVRNRALTGDAMRVSVGRAGLPAAARARGVLAQALK
jgi:hypothetical protein